ncbi:MAG: hypothetical protein SPG10_00090 [Enterocloster clostridioformis]|nr:hypothetical protein [Enterocloster clostridioformis]MDY5475388.1 hypothetical protein [Enterocloster clostridioformis]
MTNTGELSRHFTPATTRQLTDLCGDDQAIAGEAASMIEAAKEKYC